MQHVVVVGLGQVGFRVATLLQRLGEQVVVVTDKPGRDQFQEIITNAGIEIVLGDARNASVLKAARPESAKAILCCTSQDLVNIEVALDARRINPTCKVVVRMFDQDLAKRLVGPLSIDHALAMSTLSAPSFCLSAAGLDALGTFVSGGEGYVLVGNTGDPAGNIVKQAEVRRDLGFDKLTKRGIWQELKYLATAPIVIFKNAPRPLKFTAGLIVLLSFISVGIFQYGMGLSPLEAVYFVVTTLTTTGYGDISVKGHEPWLYVYACFLMLLGSLAVGTFYGFITDFIVRSRFDQMFGRPWVKHKKHIIVVGLGSVGFRAVLECRNLGIPVVAVDIDPTPRFRSRLGELDFVAGDGRDKETLNRAGIEQAMAVIACTDNDAVNLSIGLTVKETNADSRTVLRLFDGNFAQKVESSLPVDETLSASRIAAPGFVGAALFDNWLMSYVTNDSLRAVCTVPGKPGEFVFRERPLAESIDYL